MSSLLARTELAPLKNLARTKSIRLKLLARTTFMRPKVLSPYRFFVNPHRNCARSLNSFEVRGNFDVPNAFQSGANLSRFATISRPPKKTFCTDGAKTKAFSTSPKCDAGSVEFGSAQSQRQEASKEQQHQNRILPDNCRCQRSN